MSITAKFSINQKYLTKKSNKLIKITTLVKKFSDQI